MTPTDSNIHNETECINKYVPVMKLCHFLYIIIIIIIIIINDFMSHLILKSVSAIQINTVFLRVEGLRKSAIVAHIY